jgi:Tol biopolymer transport system component
MNADGSEQRHLTRTPSGDFAWSPDGRRIVFGGGYRGGPLYIVNADGSGRRTLTRTPSFAPVWSPDGRKIAFGSGGLARNSDIYSVNADGSDQRNLTRSRNSEVWFAWSPAPN